MKTKNLLFVFFALFITEISIGQTFEIRTVNKGFGTIGVEMRVTSASAPTTANHVTDLVFGIKWKNSYNVDLAAVASTAYNIKKSGTKMTKDTFNYQAFYADFTPYFFPENWTMNSWVEIMSVPNTLNGVVDTGAFIICKPGFDITTNPNIGVDLTDFSPALNGDATGVVLPVHFLNFAAQATRSNIIINWVTENEINNKGFELQRSNQNTSNFKTIGWIDSKDLKGSSANSYQFIDSAVIPETKYYYRLKEVDNDNNFSLSSTVWADLKKAGKTLLITPNPANNIVYMSNFESSGAYNISIYTSKGDKVKTLVVNNNAQPVQIDLNGLSAGLYIINAYNETKRQWGKFVKQ